MGELWLMGEQLIGLSIQHCVRREPGADHRSIAARKHVRESYWGRLLTAGADVFGNLILTHRNSLIVLPQEWTPSTWGSCIAAVEWISRFLQVYSSEVSLLFNSCTLLPKCIEICMRSSHKYLRLKTSKCTLCLTPQNWHRRTQASRYC